MPLPLGHAAFLRGVRDRLTEAARAGEDVPYGVLARSLGLWVQDDEVRKELNRCLAELMRVDKRNGRPLLAVLAVFKDGSVGPGFHRVAHKLFEYTDEEEFVRQQRAAVLEKVSREGQAAYTPSR